jgi:hypothetical protein
MHRLFRAHARIGVPALVLDVLRVLDAILGEGEQQAVRVNGRIAQREQPEREAQAGGLAQRGRPVRQRHGCDLRAAAAGAESERRGCRKRRDHEHRRDRIHQLDQRERAETAECGAGEIEAVDQADRPRAARQGKRDAHAGEDVRRDQRGDQFQPQQRREQDSGGRIEHHGRDQDHGGQNGAGGKTAGDPTQVRQQPLRH